MLKKRLIGIALIPSEQTKVKVEELATVRIGMSDRGEYYFPEAEQEVIDTLLKEVLKEENTSKLSMIFVGVEIPRRRRRRREAIPTEYDRDRARRGGRK